MYVAHCSGVSEVFRNSEAGSTNTRPATLSGYVLAKSFAIRPPQECPTRTYGLDSLAAFNSACRSATPCCAVVGCSTGVESVTVLSFRVVPGRSYAHTRLNLLTCGNTADSPDFMAPAGFFGSMRSVQSS